MIYQISKLAGPGASCYFAADKMINGGQRMRLRITVLCLIIFFLVGCSADNPNRHNTYAPLTSISVSGTYDVMADGTVNQYTAIGNFSGHFTRDITDEVSWSIQNTAIAEVSNIEGSEGLVTANSPGETIVEASFDGIFAGAAVIVSDAELTGLEITPQDAELSIGLTLQFIATGTFSDNSTQDVSIPAAWESSDTSVATIDAVGLVTAVEFGTTTISGAWQGLEASADLLVSAANLTSITITPEQATIAKGTTVQFAADGEFSNGTIRDITDAVDWQSADQGVGEVNADDGLATGISAGTTDISASFEVSGETIEDTAELIVTDAVIEFIVITPEDSTIEVEENQQFTATGIFSDDTEQDITELANWLTTDNRVGTISNTSGSRGLFAAVARGTTSVKASFGGVTGLPAFITVE